MLRKEAGLQGKNKVEEEYSLEYQDELGSLRLVSFPSVCVSVFVCVQLA